MDRTGNGTAKGTHEMNDQINYPPVDLAELTRCAQAMTTAALTGEDPRPIWFEYASDIEANGHVAWAMTLSALQAKMLGDFISGSLGDRAAAQTIWQQTVTAMGIDSDAPWARRLRGEDGGS